MKIKETLRSILNYYEVNRQAGHTTSTIEGLKNSPNACLVVANQHSAKNFNMLLKAKELNNNCVSLSELINDKLRGYKIPLLFDNHALYTIFKTALDRIEFLEKENHEIKKH